MCAVSRGEANPHGCQPAVCNTRADGWFRVPAGHDVCPQPLLRQTAHGFVWLSARPSVGADNPRRIRGPVSALETLVFLLASWFLPVCRVWTRLQKGLLASNQSPVPETAAMWSRGSNRDFSSRSFERIRHRRRPRHFPPNGPSGSAGELQRSSSGRLAQWRLEAPLHPARRGRRQYEPARR